MFSVFIVCFSNDNTYAIVNSSSRSYKLQWTVSKSFRSSSEQDSASFGVVCPPCSTETREEILGLGLGDLGTLPLSQLLRVDQDSDDGQQQAVPHVQDADQLQQGHEH